MTPYRRVDQQQHDRTIEIPNNLPDEMPNQQLHNRTIDIPFELPAEVPKQRIDDTHQLNDYITEDEEIASATLLLAASYYMLEPKMKNRKRKVHDVWVRGWLKKKSTEGAYAKLLQELRFGDSVERQLFRDFLRMTDRSFDYLLQLITPIISKKYTQFRVSISAGERLAVTLHYLATGQSFHSLQYFFRIPQCIITKIVPSVLDAIWSVLKDEFMKVSSSL